MKNIFRILMAVAVLLTASCAKEDISSSIGGGEVEVTFTASLPELGSRAFGNGENANILFYNIYEAGTENILDDLCGSVESNTGVFNVHIVLLKGMQYDLVFWAQNKDCGYYDLDGKQVTAVYEGKNANDDVRDAFYNFIPNFNPANPETTSFALHRPFAQLNAAVKNSDIDAVEASDVVLTTSTVEVDTYTGFNIATGDVTGNKSTVTFVATAVPSAETFKTGYTLLSMNYLLVPKTGMVSNAAFSFNAKKPSGDAFTFTGTSYNDVPLKQNYRTNILGELLTKPTDFTVEIEAGFNQPDKDVVQTAAELQQQIENAPDGEETEIVLGGDIDLNDLLGSLGTLSTRAATTPSLTIPAGKKIVLDLNGCTLSATENEETASYGLINNKGNLTINDSKGSGKIELTAKHNRYWNAYSSVISNQPGGVLIVNGGTIEHHGKTDMAYGIDNLTNGKGTSAVATINGGYIKSTYRAVRQFLNGVEANNSLTVNGGTIEGANKSIWMQDPSKNANTGTLTVGANASLTGNVYLSVTPDSTEWPVVVSVASAALQGESTVAHGDYLPAGYSVVEENGVWTVNFVPVAKIGDKEYGTLGAAVAAVKNGETITFVADIEQVDGVIITDKNLTIDLNKKTFTVSEGASTNNRNFKINGSSVVTIKNGTMVAAGEYSSGAYGTIRTEDTANVTLEGVKLYNYRGNGLNVKALSGTTVTINDTEIYSQYGGGVEAAGGTVELNNVTIDQKGMYTAPYNSMTISVNGGGVATVNSGTYSTECITAEEANNQGTSHGPWCAGVLNSGGKLIINGGTFSNDNFGENALATAARGILLADTAANIQINGGIFNALKAIVDVTNNLGDATRNPSVTLAGGVFSADPRVSGLYASHLISVAEGYEVKEENGRWILNFIPAAKIGETTYNTLQDAIEAVQEGATMELNRDITLAETLVIPADKNFTLDLNSKTITGTMHKDNGHVIKNEGTLTIKNGTISSTAENGGSAVMNKGTLTVEDATLNGAPNANGSWPSYAVNNTGVMTVSETTITSYHGAVASYGDNAVVTLNNSAIDMNGIPGFTSHGMYTYNSGKIVVNGGTYANKATDQNASGASVINGAIEVNAGTFSGRIENYYGTPVLKGGTYSVKPNKTFVAAGYKVTTNSDGTYSVIAE